MVNEQLSSANPKTDLEYRRKKSAEEMRYQFVSFSMMIFLTLIAFAVVEIKGFDHWFSSPFILLLAIVQVIFQLFYFMHMNKKGHDAPKLFLFSGVLAAFTIIWAFTTIIWW